MIRSTNGGATIAVRSLGKPAAAYPAHVATDADLIIAIDREQTRLALPLSAVDVSMTVENAAAIVAFCLLSIDAEIVQVMAPPAGTVVSISRGFDGTIPAVHLQGTVVSGFIDAYHHNTLVAEVEAIEQALGPNLSHVASTNKIVIASNYVWTPQTPGGSLSVGSNVVPLNPLPPGVTVGDTVYISGGTGTAEAAPVTGITGNSAIIACAGAHSGAWTIQSATGGIQEAVNFACANGLGEMYIPSGDYQLFAAVSVPCVLKVTGAGSGKTRLIANTASQDMLRFTVSSTDDFTPVIVRDMQFTTNVVPKTAGSAVAMRGAGGVGPSVNLWSEVSNCGFIAQFLAVEFVNCVFFTLHGCKIYNAPAGSTQVSVSTPGNPDEGDSAIYNNWFFAGSNPGTTAIAYSSGGGLRILGNKFLGGDNMISVFLPPNAITAQLIIVNNTFDSPAVHGVSLGTADNTGWFADVVIANNFFGGYPTSSFIGWRATPGTIKRGAITGNTIIRNDGGGIIVNLDSGSEVLLSGNRITAFDNTTSALVIGPGMSNVSVTGNQLILNGAQFTISPAASNVYFAGNQGIDNVIPTISSAATLALPLNPIFRLTGTTGITAVTAPTANSVYQGMLTTTSGPVTFTAGPSIGNTFTTVLNQPVNWYWDGAKFWLH